MLGVSLTIGILLIGTLTYFFKDQVDEQNVIIAKNILVSVENELFLATKVEPGYFRNFDVPLKLNNVDYNISITGGDLIITYNNIDLIASLPNISGNIKKGENTIRNINGKICLNIELC